MTSERAQTEAPVTGQNIERLTVALVAALPVFDQKAFAAVVEEVKARPRAALHYLFDHFGADDPSLQAMVFRILTECAGPDVVDNLNAIVFDAASEQRAKVRANDILAALGQAVDPDVFAMSVPQPESCADSLPSRVTALLSAGQLDQGLQHARALHQAERAILITDTIRRHPEVALSFIQALAADSGEDAAAVVAAVAAEKYEPALPLLRSLQASAGRALQKAIKKTLFDLRGEGLALPEAPAETAVPAGQKHNTDASLPLHQVVLSNPSSAGLALVIIARTRPDRRLKVFSVLVSLWKRGIMQAGSRISMSRSSFERFVKSQAGGRFDLREAPLDECRRLVARGMRVAREFGAPLPFDFGAGKSLLGEIDALADAMTTPFLCSACDAPLDADTINKIRASAPYDNIPVETRCAACRAHESDKNP